MKLFGLVIVFVLISLFLFGCTDLQQKLESGAGTFTSLDNSSKEVELIDVNYVPQCVGFSFSGSLDPCSIISLKIKNDSLQEVDYWLSNVGLVYTNGEQDLGYGGVQGAGLNPLCGSEFRHGAYTYDKIFFRIQPNASKTLNLCFKPLDVKQDNFPTLNLTFTKNYQIVDGKFSGGNAQQYALKIDFNTLEVLKRN